MNTALLVAAGGALGALARWLLSSALQRFLGFAFPLGTLATNLLGCLVAGWVVGLLAARAPAGDGLRPFLVLGLLGGFTTFSAFGVETLALVREGRTSAALGYVALSVAGGLAAVALGLRLAR